MRLSPTEVEKIARSILRQLGTAGVSVPDEGKTFTTISSLITQNMDEERRLEEDALKLLKQHRKAMGPGLDEEKALRMIMKKLAEERKFIL